LAVLIPTLIASWKISKHERPFKQLYQRKKSSTRSSNDDPERQPLLTSTVSGTTGNTFEDEENGLCEWEVSDRLNKTNESSSFSSSLWKRLLGLGLGTLAGLVTVSASVQMLMVALAPTLLLGLKAGVDVESKGNGSEATVVSLDDKIGFGLTTIQLVSSTNCNLM
jgi:hypothetical protein